MPAVGETGLIFGNSEARRISASDHPFSLRYLGEETLLGIRGRAKTQHESDMHAILRRRATPLNFGFLRRHLSTSIQLTTWSKEVADEIPSVSRRDTDYPSA
jgi:hypothetical protein